MAQALDVSTLDWRVALVTSSYHHALQGQHLNRGIIRGFTRSTALLQAWLIESTTTACGRISTCRSPWAGTEVACGSDNGANEGCWVGAAGSGAEGMLGSARLALLDMSRANAPNAVRFRADAEIVVVILSDTEDQTSGLYSSAVDYGLSNNWAHADIANLISQFEPIQNFIDFFDGKPTNVPGPNNTTVAVQPIRNTPIPVHAIVCTGTTRCNEVEAFPAQITRLPAVSVGRNHILGSIRDAGVDETMRRIATRIISRAGVKTQKPFIGASLRVAMDNPENARCDKTNVPRSRQHGFDYDGIEQTVSFFGDCRPPAGQESKVAFSYLTWEASNRLPCEDDPRFVNDASQGYCKGLFICDMERDVCVCPPMCGSCPESKPICDMEACICHPEEGPLN